MSDTKRLGLPLAIILLGAFAVWLIDNECSCRFLSYDGNRFLLFLFWILSE